MGLGSAGPTTLAQCAMEGGKVLGKVGAVLAPLGFGLLAIALLAAGGANAVTDTAAPSLTLPAATITNATTSRGAVVSFIAVATDDVQPTSLTCAPASGTRFAAGITTVNCTATDAASHSTSATFTITVLSASEQLGLLREAVIAMHIDPGVQQGLLDKLDSAKRSILAAQSKTACNQLNAFANQVRAQTKKAISDGPSLLGRQDEIAAALECVPSKAAPVLLGPRANVTSSTAPGLASATVRYTGPSCLPASPGVFGLGSTSVRCQVSDPNGTTRASFTVTVVDREAPILTLPADITVNAPAGSSTAVVTFTPTATDNVGIRSTVCAPASGTAFGHGITTVTCTATDTSGNAAIGTFKVTVNFAISGRITDRDTGSPLAGVRAAVFDALTGERFDLTSSGADGRYSVVVPTGSYRVRFNGDSAVPYFPQWWNGRADNETGDVITVGGSIGSIDAGLYRGFFIRGHVTRQDGTAIGGVFVNANDGLAGCCHYITGSRTGASGDYAILVRPGTYKVLFFSRAGFLADDGATYIDQWWNGAPFFDQGQPVVVGGADVGGINATMTRAVLISGRVTDATGAIPVAGLNVSAQDASQPCCHWINGAQTDASGYYQFGIPSGSSVKIEFGVFDGPPLGTRYLGQWWNNAPSFETATAVTATSDRVEINARLESAFVISGMVRGPGGAPLPNVFVGASLGGSAPCCQGVGGTSTDASGQYRLAIRPGVYRLSLSAPPDRRVVMQWWAGVPGGTVYFDRASDIAIGPLDAPSRDFDAVFGSLIQGHVTEAISGASLGNIGVSASEATIPCCESLAFAGTNGDGSYALVVPRGRQVRVQFNGGGGSSYLPQWWNNKPSFDVANSLDTNFDQPGIDARLTRSVVISGRVTDSTGTIPVPGTQVNALDAAVPCCVFIGGAQTDPLGNYRMVVAPGSMVKVAFAVYGPGTPPGTRYLGQWWNDKPSFDAATPIVANADIANVNAQLITGFLVSGHVNDREGHSLAGIHVQIIDPTVLCCPFREIAHTQTNGTGDYAAAVPAGTYKVQFFEYPLPAANPHMSQWWQQKPFEDGADLLTVAGDHPGIDAFLDAARYVRGRVTDQTGTIGIPSVFVSSPNASMPCCQFLGGTQTDATGNYSYIVPRNMLVKVQFSPAAASPYVGEWWNDKVDFASAETLFMDTDQNGIDARLTSGITISGRVTDSAAPGLGVANVSVLAQPNFGPCCGVGTSTGPDGRYSLSLTPGTYRITFFSPPGSDFLEQWWNLKPGYSAADLLTVPTTTVDLTSINAALVHGIPVSGLVTDISTGDPVPGVFIDATLEDASVPCCVNYLANTDAAGRYTLYVLPGSYRVSFQPPNTTDYVIEYWHQKPNRGLSDLLLVSGPRTDVDAQLERGFRISGRVTDAATGDPLFFSVVTINPLGCCQDFTVVATDHDGNYSVLVRAGSYKIGFNPPFGSDLVQQYWNAKSDFGTADVLVVAGAQPNISAALAHGFRLSGRVYDAADPTIPLPGTNVSAVTAGDFQFIANTAAASDGSYSLFLPAGDYILSFNGPFGSDYGFEFWNDKTDRESADVVHVAGPTPGIDVGLARNLRISGRVTDEAGNPIAGLFVNAFRPALPFSFVAGDATDANGRYSVLVPAGSYKVLFPSNGGPFLDEWWNDKTTFDTATTIDVAAASVEGIDAVLARGIVISGHIRTSDGTPLAGAIANLSDGTATCCNFQTGRLTGADGAYSFTVAPGTYFVGFYADGYVFQYWNGKTYSADADVLWGAVDHPNIDAVMIRVP